MSLGLVTAGRLFCAALLHFFFLFLIRGEIEDAAARQPIITRAQRISLLLLAGGIGAGRVFAEEPGGASSAGIHHHEQIHSPRFPAYCLFFKLNGSI